jgi:hypothetical protein
MQLHKSVLIIVLASSWFVSGCFQDPNPPVVEKPKEGIIGKKTTDIGEFDPNQEKEADLSVDTSSPLHAMTAGAYKNAAGRIAQLGIMQAVNLFNAEHGRYPKDHEEFMEKIIKANSMELPVLPGKLRYQYDVENHELKIVEAK